MTQYNATGTLNRPLAKINPDTLDTIIDKLTDYHPAITAGPTGNAHVIITYPADNLPQAITTARGLLAGLTLVGLEVIPTDLWDKRAGITPLPEMYSVPEAAARLGVTRQAVQQRIDSGSLPAVRIGKTWAIPASTLRKVLSER